MAEITGKRLGEAIQERSRVGSSNSFSRFRLRINQRIADLRDRKNEGTSNRFRCGSGRRRANFLAAGVLGSVCHFTP